MHSPIALLDLTQRTSQQPFSVSLCTPKYPSFTSPMHSQNTLSLWHSPTALLYLLLSCTPLYLSMSHSALPGSSPLFLTVHFPTALPNAVWSPLCNIMCVGEWFGENVLSVKQPHSPHRLQKKREREREREREKERYLSITLICCGWSATTFYQQDWRLPVPYHATLLTSQERPA